MVVELDEKGPDGVLLPPHSLLNVVQAQVLMSLSVSLSLSLSFSSA